MIKLGHVKTNFYYKLMKYDVQCLYKINLKYITNFSTTIRKFKNFKRNDIV